MGFHREPPHQISHIVGYHLRTMGKFKIDTVKNMSYLHSREIYQLFIYEYMNIIYTYITYIYIHYYSNMNIFSSNPPTAWFFSSCTIVSRHFASLGRPRGHRLPGPQRRLHRDPSGASLRTPRADRHVVGALVPKPTGWAMNGPGKNGTFHGKIDV